MDAAFDGDETAKSNLIIEGRLLLQQGQADEAANRFAQAATIEERLAEACAAHGLRDKGRTHLYSAAGCWARAGDFHTAIGLGEQLLADPDLPPALRQRAHDFTQTLRQRRRQWGAGLAVSSAE